MDALAEIAASPLEGRSQDRMSLDHRANRSPEDVHIQRGADPEWEREIASRAGWIELVE
jgi:hypothetical protein